MPKEGAPTARQLLDAVWDVMREMRNAGDADRLEEVRRRWALLEGGGDGAEGSGQADRAGDGGGRCG